MAKIKKLTKKEYKQFIGCELLMIDGKITVNNMMNVDANYMKFIELRHNDDFSYDINTDKILFKNVEYNSSTCAMLLSEMNELGLPLKSEAKMKRAIHEFMQNEISKAKHEEQIRKREEKEQEKLMIINGPKLAKKYVDDVYSDKLSLSTTSGQIHYNGQFSNVTIEQLINELMTRFKIKKMTAKEILKEAASKHKFVEVKTVNNEHLDIDENNYLAHMNYGKDNSLLHTIWNYKLFLKYNDLYKDRIKFNGLDKNEYFMQDNGKWVYVNDTQMGYIYSDIEQFFNFNVNKGNAEKAFYMACQENTYHPIKSYFNKIRSTYNGEGTEKAETLFIKFLNAEDNKLNRQMTLKWLLAAVKMIEEEPVGEDDQPVGWDNMIILFGPQGIGKSKLIQRLFGARYTQTNIDITNEQEYVDKLNKAWVGVFEELAKFNNKEMGAIKDFLTKTDNTVRLSYGRRSTFYPRHVVFVGNTNKQHFLRDYDTNYERRFWVIECNGNGHSREWWSQNLTQQYIDDIWGEVLQLYDSDEYKLDLDEEDIESLKKIQLKHKSAMEDDILCDDIYKILERKYTKQYFDSDKEFFNNFDDNWNILECNRIYALNEIPVTWMTRLLRQKNTKFYEPIMSKYGWEQLAHGHSAYRNTRVWHRKIEIPYINLNETNEFFATSHNITM